MTTYYKLNGEILTAAEAEAAANNFTPASGYSFRHWSSSASSDVEVTALNPGGAGITITQNRSFYPVIGLTDWVAMTKSDSTISYTAPADIWDKFSYGEPNIYDDGNSINFSTSTRSHRVYVVDGTIGTALENAYEAGAGGSPPVSDITGTTSYASDKGFCDFGTVSFPASAGAYGYTITSEVDGQTYYLKMIVSQLSGSNYNYTISVHKLINSVITNITANTRLIIIS